MWVFLCIKYTVNFLNISLSRNLLFSEEWKKHQLTIFQIKICCCILTASWQQFTVNKINSKKVANFGHSFQNYITYIFFTRFLYTYTCIKSTKNKDNNFFHLQNFLSSSSRLLCAMDNNGLILIGLTEYKNFSFKKKILKTV